MMDRRRFLQSAAGTAGLTLPGQQPQRKPNLLLILADDMGFADAGCYGGDIETPHLDRLAANGLRFTQAYSTARCGPSRSCLLTGHYAQQTAADTMTPGNVPQWTRFLPEYLRPHGYRSYHSGKWHLRFDPMRGTGFDGSYLLLDENRYFTPRAHQLNGQPLPAIQPEDGYYVTRAVAEHGVRFLRQHAKEHANDPFLLYLAFTSPHFPLHALQEDIERYQDRFADGWDAARARRFERQRRMGLIKCSLAPLEAQERPRWSTPDAELAAKIGPGEVSRAVPWSALTPEQQRFQRTKMALHAAMITRMDREIGRVIEQLRATNQLDNTLIAFLSDNGASAEFIIRGDGHDPAAAPGSAASYLCLGPGWASAANTPFRLHKSYVHEGGIASPLIVHWPAGIKAKGQLRHDPCHFIDVVPTVLELAGSNAAAALAPGAPPLPGRSLTPAFAKSGSIQRELLYFHHNHNRALRAGDWKAVGIGQEGPWELYNLSQDRAEQRNLAREQPAQLTRLTRLWQEREAEFVRVREAAPPTRRAPLDRRSW